MMNSESSIPYVTPAHISPPTPSKSTDCSNRIHKQHHGHESNTPRRCQPPQILSPEVRLLLPEVEVLNEEASAAVRALSLLTYTC